MSLDSSKQLDGKMLGTCTLQSLLGRGGMGAVYLASQQRPRRTVAVKVLLPELSQDTTRFNEFLARFRREADAIASLDHVNIMPIYEYGEQDQLAYLVMPYVTGGTLRDVITKRTMLPLNEAIAIAEQIASALDYAHQHGIIHRDLKPGNILFHADGRLLLTDFGIAKVLGESADTAAGIAAMQTLTTTGTIIGTPEYLSPEQAAGAPVDQRSDIYSLGVVLYQLLTGHVPFSGTTPVAVAIKHALEAPPSLLQFNSAIPPAIEQVIMKALAKKPEQRYSTAGELARALRSAFFAAHTVLSQAATPDVSVSSNTSNGQKVLNYEGEATIAVPDSSPAHDESAQAVPLIVQLSTAPTVIAEQPATSMPVTPATIASKPPVTGMPSPAVEKPHEALTVSAAQRPHPQQAGGRLPLWIALLSAVLVIALVSGGVILYMHQSAGDNTSLALNHGTKNATPKTRATARSTTAPAPVQTTLPPLPLQSIAVGSQLYGVLCPAYDNLWTPNAALQAKCSANGTLLTNTNAGQMENVLLTALPGGAAIPNDYVLQFQVEPLSMANGTFDILFRMQTGTNNHGGYEFTIQPPGSWVGYSMDNTTGQQAQLFSSQGASLSTSGFMTIDIVVQGSAFMLYFNGYHYGGITSSAYTSGTLGLGVAGGAQVLFKNLGIYALS